MIVEELIKKIRGGKDVSEDQAIENSAQKLERFSLGTEVENPPPEDQPIPQIVEAKIVGGKVKIVWDV